MLACSGEPPAPAAPEPIPSADTAPQPQATCRIAEDNALRLLCEVSLAEPAGVRLSLQIPGEPTRSQVHEQPALHHTVAWWDLPPQVEISWSVEALGGGLYEAGLVSTGALPPGLEVDFVTLIDGPSQLERLFFPWSCEGYGFLLATDGEGVVRWYEPFGLAYGVDGVEVSDRGSFLALANRNTLSEFRFDGLLSERSIAEQTLPGLIHHDVASRNGQTLLLTARAETLSDGLSYVIDGVLEVDDDVSGDWYLDQVLEPVGLSEPPGAYWFGLIPGIDFAHANSIDVDERGMWLISFKHLDTVLAVVGDPSAPDRGEIAWALVGGERGEPLLQEGLPGLLEPIGPLAFEFQHHARWEAPGLITLFDNGRDISEPSRVLRIRLDEGAGTAQIVSSFELNERCPIQSSGYPLADGSMVATCAASRNVYEFDPDGTLRRQIALTCPTGSASMVVRSVPMSFWAD